MIIRLITINDTDARHRFWVELSYEQTGMVHTYDETDLHRHETHDKIRDFLHSNRGLWLVAFNNNDEIIGEIDITVKNLVRVKHVGVLTVGILKQYQSQGLGSALMNEALAWAKSSGLRRLELFVFASNEKAQNLYKKFGFTHEGTRKNFLRHGENNFEDDFLMAAYI
jgi:ribosomal-protein-alanine N-acetyltransferase